MMVLSLLVWLLRLRVGLMFLLSMVPVLLRDLWLTVIIFGEVSQVFLLWIIIDLDNVDWWGSVVDWLWKFDLRWWVLARHWWRWRQFMDLLWIFLILLHFPLDLISLFIGSLSFTIQVSCLRIICFWRDVVVSNLALIMLTIVCLTTTFLFCQVCLFGNETKFRADSVLSVCIFSTRPNDRLRSEIQTDLAGFVRLWLCWFSVVFLGSTGSLGHSSFFLLPGLLISFIFVSNSLSCWPLWSRSTRSILTSCHLTCGRSCFWHSFLLLRRVLRVRLIHLTTLLLLSWLGDVSITVRTLLKP